MSRLLPLLMVFASGCSVAIDFDRSYRVENSTFPKQLLEERVMSQSEGSPSVAGPETCKTFCDHFIGCVANVDVCHLYSVENTGTSIGPSAAAYHVACEADCLGADSLTAAQLSFIKNGSDCSALARDVIELTQVSETNPNGLDCDEPYRRDCKFWCDPSSGSEGFTKCPPDVVPPNQEGCEASCVAQDYAFHACIARNSNLDTFCMRFIPCEWASKKED